MLSDQQTSALDGMGEWDEQGEGEESLEGLSNSQAYGSCTTLSLIPLFAAM
jgi:hypothetical protein